MVQEAEKLVSLYTKELILRDQLKDHTLLGVTSVRDKDQEVLRGLNAHGSGSDHEFVSGIVDTCSYILRN